MKAKLRKCFLQSPSLHRASPLLFFRIAQIFPPVSFSSSMAAEKACLFSSDNSMQSERKIPLGTCSLISFSSFFCLLHHCPLFPPSQEGILYLPCSPHGNHPTAATPESWLVDFRNDRKLLEGSFPPASLRSEENSPHPPPPPPMLWETSCTNAWLSFRFPLFFLPFPRKCRIACFFHLSVCLKY